MNEQFNDYGQNPYNDFYSNDNQPPKKIIWASVASFVLGLVNIVFCCCGTYILAPLSIIFGIVALVKKYACKGLAIAGVVISSVTLILTIVSSVLINTTFREPYEDMMKFIMNADSYIQEYQETGEVPDDFSKYCDPEYNDWWDRMGYDGFEDFYDDYIKGFMSEYDGNYSNDYRDRNNRNNRYSDDDDDGDRYDRYDDFGENPIDL